LTDSNKHTGSKKSRRKWPWITLLCIAAFIGLLRLALMSGPVQAWVKNTIVETANNQLEPTLSIETLSGDLWNSITLTNIRLTQQETVASVDTVHLEYNPLSYFGDVFEIDEVRLVRPFMKIEQQQDSTLNVQNWVSVEDTSSSTFKVSVSDFNMQHGRFDVTMPQLKQDSSFIVDDMNITASLGYYGDEYEATLHSFNTKIRNTRLNEPVSISAAADASDKAISLQKLTVATGKSMLRASGQARLADSTADFEFNAEPLAWKDMRAFVDSLPVQQNINASLQLKGDAEAFNIQLNANAPGIENLSLSSSIQGDSSFALTAFQASAQRLDFETFLGDTAMPRLSNFALNTEGYVPLNNYQQGRIEGTVSADNIRQSGYQLDRIESKLSLQNGAAKIQIEPIQSGRRMAVNADLSGLWGDQPNVLVTFSGQKINPANWLQDQAYAGSLTFNGRVWGTGWFPEKNVWNYRLTATDSRLNEQQIDRARFTGTFNQSRVSNETEVYAGQSRLRLEAEAHQFQSVPQFSYTLTADDVNLSNIAGFEDYPSSLNATITGEGQGQSLQTLELQTSVAMDSSIFKGEIIQRVASELSVVSETLTIQNTVLESGIANANVSGQIYIPDFYNADNGLNFDMQLKDLSSLASLAGAQVLQTTGSIEGSLRPRTQDSLVFEGTIDLENVNYNNEYTAQSVSGDVLVELQEEPEYDVDIDIAEPMFASVNLKNIAIKTEGRQSQTATKGSYEINLTGTNEGSISQSGSYNIGADTTAVTLTAFELSSAQRTLSLQDNFYASLANGAIQTDTLHMRSNNGTAFVELAVPFADSLNQTAYLKASQLNLSALQDAILDESYFQATLSGEANVQKTDTSMTASANIAMTELVYDQTKLDTLRLKTDIKNERLTGMLKLHQNGDLIIEGHADIPFNLKKPAELSDEFLAKPVSGHLKLNAVELQRFNTLLTQAGFENTEGTLRFNGQLGGTAGQPEVNATGSLKDAVISGVPVDSLTAGLDYNHNDSSLKLNAALTSLKQKALQIDAKMPLSVDMQNLEVNLPGPQDSVLVDVQTNNFNLEALNDFINPEMARNITGQIDGNVKISGSRSDLESSGQLKLKKGSVRLVTAGIKLDDIQSTIQFEPGTMVLQNLSMKSGKGKLTARGELGLEELMPGDIDIKISAQNFKAANTDEYNALINLDLSLGGTVTSPDISGDLDVINGFVKLNNFGEQSVEQVQLDTTLAPETQSSLYDSLSLNMDVEFNRRFFVRNERYLEMEIELDGQLDILKDAGKDLQLFGTLNTTQGYARPLGKRFELEEGSLAFSGPPNNPQMNIRTLYEPPQTNQEIKIWYIIEGTVEDPMFKYESNPPMDLAGILSYTLFGQPFYKLNSAEQSVASSSSNNAAADFAMEVLLDRVESLATQRLGIDVVRIEQTRVGGESGTSITTGWYINPKVFFAIQNVITGSTPTPGFYLEYYLSENLKLILSQGSDNRQGVDVQWEYDY
jgi:autotransporter translocation and assembly factor TamB